MDVFDINPEWSEHLKYNPISNIIKNGKAHHLIGLMKDVFGVKINNPIIGNIRYFYYAKTMGTSSRRWK